MKKKICTLFYVLTIMTNMMAQTVRPSDYRWEANFNTGTEEHPDSIYVRGYVGQKLQIKAAIGLVEPLMMDPLPKAIDYVSQTDINFDGTPDLLIYKGTNAAGSMAEYYVGYIWDKILRKYVHCKEVEDIESPVFDATKKQVTSSGRYSADKLFIVTYRWQRGRLVKVSEKITDI